MAERISLRDYQRDLAARLRTAADAGRSASKLAVQAGEGSWLVDLQESGEVIPVPPITAVPQTRPWFKGVAPIVKDATSFGQWFTDSTYTGNTHVVSALEMVPAGGGQYQFSSGSHAVYGGFFPLDPTGQYPPGTNSATPAGPGPRAAPRRSC